MSQDKKYIYHKFPPNWYITKITSIFYRKCAWFLFFKKWVFPLAIILDNFTCQQTCFKDIILKDYTKIYETVTYLTQVIGHL